MQYFSYFLVFNTPPIAQFTCLNEPWQNRWFATFFIGSRLYLSQWQQFRVFSHYSSVCVLLLHFLVFPKIHFVNLKQIKQRDMFPFQLYGADSFRKSSKYVCKSSMGMTFQPTPLWTSHRISHTCQESANSKDPPQSGPQRKAPGK